jgi:hypothetical protein
MFTMKGDFSRLRFSPNKNYTSVLQQQGRVSLDADTNEQCAINDYLRTTETVDVVGAVGGPKHDEGFKITIHDGAIKIGKGRYYVEGILCENDQPLLYSEQPFLIDPNPTDRALLTNLQQGSVIQVYLQVWRRLVTALDDPCLREPALGQADTTARLQTVWRVVAKELTSTQTEPQCCDSMHTGLVPEHDPGKLSAQTGSGSGDCSCQPTPAAGYLGLENQLYRVEIHQAGNAETATFKWSRENGSVVVAVKQVSGTQVSVDSLSPDTNLGFAPLQWVEIYDDSNLFGPSPNQPGNLYYIQSTSPETLSVTLSQPVPAGSVDPTKNARMRRWDQSGSSAGPNGLSLSAGSWLSLENGIQVEFSKGNYASGDYWLIPARTATGNIEWPAANIEWPPCNSDGDPCQPAHRIEIFEAPLACIQWDKQKRAPHVQDCRKSFPPLTELTPCKSTTCCTYRVGDNEDSFGDFTSIQSAIDALPDEGGEVCILPGRYYENVFILGRRDIVIHGCGWQTRVASRSLKANNPGVSHQATKLDTTGATNPIAAVFTIAASAHIELRSFAVEAADDEAGVLIDGTETSLSTNRTNELARLRVRLRGVTDVTLKDMVLTAATYPAVLAQRVELLRIDRNRVAMKNVSSRWHAIYASGTEIHIDQNWVGIQSAANDNEWLPYTVTEDLSGATVGNSAPGAPTMVSGSSTAVNPPAGTRDFINTSALLISAEIALHPGGIQIGGASTDVYILENEIEGGSRNGITLGSFDVLDANGNNTGKWTGSTITSESDDCNCTGTLQVLGSYPGTTGYTVVAGGILTNIQIHRNRIRNMGLCGIGPVGFFNLLETLEIITTVGLNISANAISLVLLRDLATTDSSTSTGYGAICLPDVLNPIIRDNTITDFGAQPGANVCGIFILHGEMIEISRNQVLETRDWRLASEGRGTSSSLSRGGIVILSGTPPAFPQALDSSLWGYAEAGTLAPSTPIYEPALPAARVEHNVVRVPLSHALAIVGLGPFAVVNNHFGCGGMVPATGVALAQTVLILNVGTAIESATAASLPSGVSARSKLAGNGITAASSQNVACGAVLFSNNMCQLEATASLQREDSSVLIVTPDHLIFSNNHCWLDTSRVSALVDALLVAGSLNVVGNRFQEAPLSVLLSALTIGLINITGQNISTFCILVLGFLRSDNNNIALVQLVERELCASLEKAFSKLP